MTATESKPTNAPAYVSFKTFSAFVESLSTSAMPSHIDKSVMTKMSGITKTQLLSALKFLQIIDKGGKASKNFQDLVQSCGTEKWKGSLGKVVQAAYATIIGELDVETASSQQLRNALKNEGHIDGQMLDKAIRFYVKGMRESGLKISPHFSVHQRIAARTKKPRTKKKKSVNGGRTDSGRTLTEDECPEGCIPIPLYMPGKARGMIYVPEDLDEADCDMIDSILRAYAKRRANK